ncbi:MAG: chemotaxis protein CheC [Solirubrobacterales bacterium]|nr:chemotaxis protein CheC [Solirubrobacterales bacterium]
MSTQFNDLQLDALRELANIGSGNASTALSGMLGRPVDISVPVASALPLADAVEAIGDAESEVTGVMLGIVGELTGSVILLVSPDDAATLCNMLGVDVDSEWGLSALGEIGNIVGASYINALAVMTGFAMEPTPPSTTTDMLGAIVASALAEHADGTDVALVLDSEMSVEGDDCEICFLLIPRAGGVKELLARLGIDS